MAANDTENDRNGLASEYVLGTLSEVERIEAERLLEHDYDFKQAVSSWQNRLAPLLDTIPLVDAPSSHTFDKIMRRVNMRPSAQQDDTHITKLKRSMSFWRASAIAASIVAACLIVTIISREITRPPEGNFVAVLETKDRIPAFVASLDLKRKIVHVVRIGPSPAQDKSYELWALGAGRKEPQSLGVISESTDIAADKLGRIESTLLQKTTFAISLEPKGGSPTGKVTGPVLFTGKLVPLTKK